MANFTFYEDEIQTGPCSMWLDIAVPATGAYVDLDDQGRPSAPGGYHLGYTRAGARITIETLQSPFEADQSQEASRRLAWTAGCMVEASLLQTAQGGAYFTLLRRMMPAAALNVENLTFGGAVAPEASTHTSLIVTWLHTENQWGKAYAYFLLYYGRNTAPQSVLNVTRQDAMSLDIQFRGLPLTSRVRSDWYGHFHREATPAP